MDYSPADKTFRFPAGPDADAVVIGNAARGDRVEAHVSCSRWGGEIDLAIKLVGRSTLPPIGNKSTAGIQGMCFCIHHLVCTQ